MWNLQQLPRGRGWWERAGEAFPLATERSVCYSMRIERPPFNTSFSFDNSVADGGLADLPSGAARALRAAEPRPMKLAVDQLSATPSEFHFVSTASWWEERLGAGEVEEWKVLEPAIFDLTAYTAQADLCLEGRVEALLEVTCGRCLARYRHALRDEFRLVLEPAGDRNPAEPEAAAALARDGICLGEALESGLYRGKEILLDSFFSEVAALALPVQPVCREDCAGLCPTCGVDRNATDCGCTELKPTSPFAVLEVLRGGKSEGSD